MLAQCNVLYSRITSHFHWMRQSTASRTNVTFKIQIWPTSSFHFTKEPALSFFKIASPLPQLVSLDSLAQGEPVNSPGDWLDIQSVPGLFTKLHFIALLLSSSFGKQQKSCGVQKTQGPVLHTGYAPHVIDRQFTTAQFQLALRFTLNLLDLH